MESLLALVCFLVGLILVLAFVTVVGHGIWVMVAAIFGSSKRRVEDHDPPRMRRRSCLGCGESLLRTDKYCPSCGLDPDSRSADELKDLEATARTIDHLFDHGSLSAEIRAQIDRSIERRRGALMPGRRREDSVELSLIAQLEAWFGKDQGAALTVEGKRGALAVLRSVPSADLRELSPRALLGIARLQASVGMLSRACQAYRILLHRDSQAPFTKLAALEAIQAACKAEDWSSADDFVRIASDIPGLIDKESELAMLIGQVRTRKVGNAPVPAVVPVVTPAVEAPIPATLGEPMVAPSAASRVRDVPPVVEPPFVLTVAEPEETPEPVASPRRSFAEWIAVFMEESNILWGELIGGTLIVGCSIALVISLWTTLEQIEFFPFIILAAITGGLFGAGFYTLHHWKLESTSRGLLLIATLLVPLDFLVLAGLTRNSEAGLIDYSLGMTALAAFGWLLYRSSRILVQTPLELPIPSALLVTLSLLISAGMQLVALGGLARQDWQPAFLYPLSLLPVLGQVVALGWILLRLRALPTWSLGQLVALLIAVGSTTFACSITVGFPLFDADNLRATLLHLSPALTLIGAPILIAGTLIHQKLGSASESGLEKHGLWRTLGTGLGLAGVFVMFGGFAVSIAEPIHRSLCGSINIGTLLAVAWFLRVPALHAFAQVYLAMLVVYGGAFHLDELAAGPGAALRLSGLLVLQTLLAEGLIRVRRAVDARYYAIGSGVTTVLAGILIAPSASDHPGITAIVLGIASLNWLAANLRWRLAEITYGSALVLAAAIFFAFRETTDLPVHELILWSLLTHATICLLAGVAMRFASIAWFGDVFRIPLQIATLIASFVVAAVILGEQFPALLSWPSSCVACCWLAALWLIIAVLEGSPILFGAFQVLLGVTWIFGAGDWLTGSDWDWREPYCLHIYAIGFGVCSLAWELSRLAFWSRPRVAALLAPPFVPIDRLLTGGLVVGQYVLSLIVVSWSIGRELSAADEMWRVLPADWYANAYSIGAWLLPALLAGVLMVWWKTSEGFGALHTWALVGLTLLALTIPLLIAGAWFDADHAAASAARWGLALCYGLCSLLMWFRRGERVPAPALRALLIGGAVTPILFITLKVVAATLAGQMLPGPLDGMFTAMGGPASLLIPLALVSATLAGHGFRERLAYYLLAAGLLANASSVGAYFLALQQMKEPFGQAWVAVDAFLLASAVAWIWSIVWTWIASLLEPGETRPLLHSPLLPINGCIGTLLFVAAMSRAIEWIMLSNDEPGRIWTQAAGSIWCWLTFTATAVGSCYLFWKRQSSLPLHLLGVLSMTAVGAIACSVELLWPGHGFLALMFGSGLYACVWVWSNLFLDPQNSPRWLTCTTGLLESVIYAVIPAGLASFMGFSALVNREIAPVWAANSVLLAALACGLLGYQRRTEIWASFASLLMMLAGTILVVHFDNGNRDLWLVTIQANLALLGAMSLVRLALHRFLAPMAMPLSHLHQLPVQIALGMTANLLLLYFPLGELLLNPRLGGADLQRHADWSGWLAILTNAIAAVWFASQVQPRRVVHIAALIGLLLGVVLAGSADFWLGGDWTAQRVLTLTWTLLGLLLIAVSWLSHPQDRRVPWGDFFPEMPTRVWVSVIGGFVVMLALRAAWVEPETPYWSVGNTFATAVLLAALAIWARTGLYVFGSGLLFNVIGLLLYRAWIARHPNLAQDEEASDFLLAQVLSFGVAASVWSLLERLLHRKQIDILHGFAPFTQAAIFAGIALLAADVVFTNALHLSGEVVHVGMGLAWISLGVLAGAVLLEGWRPNVQRFMRPQLYAIGLLAIGILLQQLSLSVLDWQWAATVLLAGYVLLVVAVLRIFDDAPDWLWDVQLMTIGLVLLASAWITLTFPTWPERLGGALATALITSAAFLLVRVWPRIYPPEEESTTTFNLHHRLFPHYLVLSLGILFGLEGYGALIDPEMNAVWLQRTAAAMAVIMAATVVYRFVVPRGLAGSSWAEASRSLGAILGIGSVLLLMGLIGLELAMYNADPHVRKTPMRLDLVIGAGIAILGLTILSVNSALTREADPYGIENDRRGFYVYLAELLALATFAHLRLNVPDIFSGLIGKYWYFVVIVIAFVALTLSEIFQRKQLPILATPLKRSAVLLAFIPVLAFRLAPLARAIDGLSQIVPGVSPFLRILQNISAEPILYIPAESLCWLLLGIFFGSLAQLRKSANYGIAAALAINFGVWVLLSHQDATAFFERPQLWLIPLGLIVLVAEFINRRRLGFWPSLWLRYAGLLCIYLSSTFEMFMAGLGSNPIYPIILALLAVAGMMLGILFRVRAFLLSGFMALLIVVFAQIWLAAVVHANTWVWWVCGIVLGVIILALFALFEKHRNEVAKMVDNMKRWQ